MTAKVLLITTVPWPSAGRLAGAFAATGCVVDALLPADHPASRSRYFERVYAYRPLGGVSSFLDAAEQSHSDAVLALDDRATALLLQARERAPVHIAALIGRSLGCTENYAQLMSRNGFIEAARQADIRTPLTCSIENENDLEGAIRQIGFPAVLKADGTWGGDGVAVVHDRNEALLAWRRLSKPPSLLRSLARALRRSDAHFLRSALDAQAPAVSMQQFIAGRPATTSFACWQGKLLAANHLETLAAQEANGPASVLRRLESEEMEQAAARLAAHFGLSGLHGLDYVRDGQGRAHLIEINPRSPQTSYLSFGAGHDLVSALAARVDGHARPPRPRVAGDVVALFPQEWMRDPASPYLTSAFHDVPWDDPVLIRAWMESQQARPALEKWRAFMASAQQGASFAAQS
ncbi:MAG: ATP-grasp domain-containing protein [Proteobacteria bacterium]|nr:ATP-grasp domain-containing protein [Pseudomonadota bacterium]